MDVWSQIGFSIVPASIKFNKYIAKDGGEGEEYQTSGSEDGLSNWQEQQSCRHTFIV